MEGQGGVGYERKVWGKEEAASSEGLRDSDKMVVGAAERGTQKRKSG